MDVIQNKKVLLTGASGFIGASLSRELVRRDALVHALVRPSSNLWRLVDLQSQIIFHNADVNDDRELSQIVRTVEPQIVIHLAFPSGHPEDRAGRQAMIKTGLWGTANLLEALVETGVERVLSLGSSMVYDAQEAPLSELAPLRPSSFRGAVKAAGTLLCQQYTRQLGQLIIVLRPFAVYGPWETPPRFIPTAILAALRGQTIQLTPPGFRHDFLFIEDLIEACMLSCLVELEGFEIINIGTSQEWTNEEVVDILETVSGRKLDRRVGAYPPRPWDTAHWVADITKAKRLLGWQPKHNLQHGMEKTFAWFRQNMHLYDAHTTSKTTGSA